MRQNEIDRERIRKDLEAYLAKGGKITECPPCHLSDDLRKAQEGISEIYLVTNKKM